MTCSRCKGLMVAARISDYYQLFYERRCVNCGAIVFRPTAGRRRASRASSHQRRPVP